MIQCSLVYGKDPNGSPPAAPSSTSVGLLAMKPGMVIMPENSGTDIVVMTEAP